MSTSIRFLLSAAETVALCWMIYYVIRGIKTKNYGYAWVCGAVYLIILFIRNFYS